MPGCSAIACPTTAPGPGHDVEGAGRQARLGEQLARSSSAVSGVDGGGLQDDGVAERERRRDLPHRLQEREVPGRDRADDADRLAQRQQERVGAPGEGVAVELVRVLAEVGRGTRRRPACRSWRPRRWACRCPASRRVPNSSARESSSSAARIRIRPRWRGFIAAHGPGLEGRARGGDGAVEVLRPASATSASVSPVAGLTVAKRLPRGRRGRTPR